MLPTLFSMNEGREMYRGRDGMNEEGVDGWMEMERKERKSAKGGETKARKNKDHRVVEEETEIR